MAMGGSWWLVVGGWDGLAAGGWRRLAAVGGKGVAYALHCAAVHAERRSVGMGRCW